MNKNTVPPATAPSKGKTPTNSASAGKAKTGVAARSSAPTPPTSNTIFNKECLSILREMNSNISKNNEKVEKLSQRVDALYEEEEHYPENENDFQSGYDLYDYDPNNTYDQEAEEDSVSVSQSVGSYGKRSSSELEVDDDDIFSHIIKKFRKADKVDPEVNQHLADMINATFREG